MAWAGTGTHSHHFRAAGRTIGALDDDEGLTMQTQRDDWASRAVAAMLERVRVMARTEWLRRASELSPSTPRSANGGQSRSFRP